MFETYALMNPPLYANFLSRVFDLLFCLAIDEI